MRLLAAALLAAMLASCGDEPSAPAPHEPALENGIISNPDDWDAVWIGNCTGAKVGPRVIQTAAHCVRTGETRTVKIGASSVKVTFTNHSAYSEAAFKEDLKQALEGSEQTNATADWALGVTDADMPGPYTPLLLTPGRVALGDTVTLSGFGCRVWGGPLDGQFRIGSAKIIRLPSGNNFNVVTQGGAALCSGDSGGPSFVNVDGVRHVLAPNSSRLLSGLTSYIPPWYNAVAANWVKSWANSKGLVLCGVGLGDSRCRGSVPQPPPPSPSPSPSPEPTPPGPTPVPPQPSVNACKGAMLRLEAKLFNKPYGDATAELEYLKACSTAAKPMPETAVAP